MNSQTVERQRVMAIAAVGAACLGLLTSLAEAKDQKDQRSAEAKVRQAYWEALARAPDPEGLKTFTAKANEGWSADDIARALAKSQEYTQTDTVIRRAYRQILGRMPDPSGLSEYRKRITEQGWDQDRVEKALKSGPEYSQPETIVRRAYAKVLYRDPDAVGMRNLKAKVEKEGWSEDQVRKALTDSEEYRNAQ